MAGSWMQKVEVLYSAETVRQRVAELGQEITRDYQGKDLCVLGILKGSIIFMSDLIRSIDLPLTCDFIGISSYGKDTESSGVVKITSDLTHPIEGLDILIAEDIVDTGLSMAYLLKNLATRKPKSIKVCTLCEKSGRRQIDVPMHYVGFHIPNHFVVGYGFDVAERFRNLPFIGVYRE